MKWMPGLRDDSTCNQRGSERMGWWLVREINGRAALAVRTSANGSSFLVSDSGHVAAEGAPAAAMSLCQRRQQAEAAHIAGLL